MSELLHWVHRLPLSWPQLPAVLAPGRPLWAGLVQNPLDLWPSRGTGGTALGLLLLLDAAFAPLTHSDRLL